MLNSQDLEELKIQALANNSSHNNPLHYFSDLAPILSSSSSDHFIIKQSTNSNIFAFTYILLTQIFEARTPNNYSPAHYVTPHSHDSGRGSIHPEGTQSHQVLHGKQNQREQYKNCSARAKKLCQFLFSEKTNFAEIKNMPHCVVSALRNCLKKSQPSTINLYLKKLLVQFLQELELSWKQSILCGSKYQEGRKQSIVWKLFQKYPVCESLFNMLIRCILNSEYEITQALDYSQQVSDHTVYTALCDAFLYSSLHIEDNHIEISLGNFIWPMRLKQKHKQKITQTIYYLVSTPQYKSEGTSPKEILGSDTFRVRKKSSDVSSNNQSISFRQTSKAFHPQQNFSQNRSSIKNQCITLNVNISKASQNIQKINTKDEAQIDRWNPEMENPQRMTMEKQQSQGRMKNQNKRSEGAQDKKLQKSTSDQIMHSSSKKEDEKGRPALNGYTSLQILKQLNPKVRESMLKTITYFKKYQP